MSRSIENRLGAALEARAALVTPEHLRPLDLPAPRRTVRPPRAAALLLVAAASAAILVTPFLLSGDDGATPSPVGPPSTTPSDPSAGVSESGDPVESTPLPPGLTVVARQQADVDGDRQPDQVRVLLDATDSAEPAESFVEVRLASGGTAHAPVPFGYAPTLLPAYDLGADFDEQVMLSHTAGGDEAQLLVYTWIPDATGGGELVQARPDGDAPLARGLDGQGRYVDHFTDQRGLWSWERLEPVGGADDPVFTARMWAWSLDGDRLVPHRDVLDRLCVDVTTEEPPQRC